jgi:hypothetical protein
MSRRKERLKCANWQADFAGARQRSEQACMKGAYKGMHAGFHQGRDDVGSTASRFDEPGRSLC